MQPGFFDRLAETIVFSSTGNVMRMVDRDESETRFPFGMDAGGALSLLNGVNRSPIKVPVH